MLNNQLDFLCQPFSELTALQFHDIIQAREAIFIVEQQCAYVDVDGLDINSWHLQGLVVQQLACYARIIPPTMHTSGQPTIGRVICVPDYRHHGYARLLMQQAIAFCHTHFPQQPIYISAQLYLRDFYQSLGFIAQGDVYLEDNIPHIAMLLG